MLIALQTFSKWCLIAEFQVNRDFIAKNLCVNRLKPISCCKGKCYLDKKIAADESQDQAPGKSAQKEETVLQVPTAGNHLPEPVDQLVLTDHSTRHLDDRSQDWSLSFFQPPRIISLI